jgi:hypothetical protein
MGIGAGGQKRVERRVLRWIEKKASALSWNSRMDMSSLLCG